MKKMRDLLISNAHIMILIGGAIAVVGAFLQQVQANKDQKALLEKNEQIAQLSTNLAQLVTGGNSFCYAIPMIKNYPADRDVNVPFTLLHLGKIPAFDVYVRVHDVDHGTMSIEETMMNRVAVGTVTSAEPIHIPLYLPFRVTDQERRFNFFISSRNGFYTEVVKFKKINGNWKLALRVYKRDATGRNGLIYEQRDPDFPAIKEAEWQSQ